MMIQSPPAAEFVNLDELDKLAKLLASENIFVEHANVPTASFDTVSRVLSLPMWKNMKRELYHMLVLHEIGHALYTDNDLWVKTVKENPKIKDILNVIEDARIERMVKNKYLGSRRDFREGYKILHDQNFFGISNKNLSEFNFIDRINIHYKLGDYVSVPFSKKELSIIDQIDTLKTLEEVVALANSLSDKFSREKENESHAAGSDENSSEDDSEFSQDISNSSEEQSEEKTEDDGSSFGQSENDGSDGDEMPDNTSQGSSSNISDEFVSSTQKSMETNISQNNIDKFSRTSYHTVDVTLPYRDFIIPYKVILKDVSADYSASELSEAKNYRVMRNKNISMIDYLVKEFELRKAAHQYQRSRENKTGVINPNKLHAYSLVDDIFRKNTVVPNSKSHGIVFFLDFSGSMSHKMMPTIEQLLNLILFCRKVNIPHRVYAFSDAAYVESDLDARFRNLKNLQEKTSNRLLKLYKGNRTIISVSPQFSLVELFHNKMNSNEVRNMFEALINSFKSYYDRTVPRSMKSSNKYFNLGGTPLDSATLLAFPLLKDFKKETGAQIISSVFLTDGESTGTEEYYLSGGKARLISRSQYVGSSDVYINPVTKKNYKSKMVNQYGKNYLNDVLTEMLADEGYHTIAFRVDDLRSLKKEIQYRMNYQQSAQSLCKKLSRDNCATAENFRGYAQYHFIRNLNSKDDEDEDMFEGLDPNATRHQITRAFIKARTDRLNSRAVLAKFAEKVAA